MLRSLARWSPWLLALLWLGIRVAAGKWWFPGDIQKAYSTGVLTNIAFVLIAVFVALISSLRDRPADTSYGHDVRTGLRGGVQYVIGAVICMGVYYSSISDELAQKRLADRRENAELISTPEQVARIKETNEALRGLTAEQILQSANERTDAMTSTKVILSGSFIALTFSTVMYALLAAFLFRQFLVRDAQ